MSRARRIGATRIDLNELIKRSALAVLAILAVLLPVLKVSLVSESDDIVLGDFRLLGGAAYLRVSPKVKAETDPTETNRTRPARIPLSWRTKVQQTTTA